MVTFLVLNSIFSKHIFRKDRKVWNARLKQNVHLKQNVITVHAF